MSKHVFCNCPAGFSADPERHAPDCPGRSGAGKPSTMTHQRFSELMGRGQLERKTVACPCGNEYPANSYGAGFIAGSGMCENCDAEIPARDIATPTSAAAASAHARPGYDALWQWFGLSRSSYAVLPRVMMHDMPDAWQARMAGILEDWDATWVNQPSITTQVQVLDESGKFAKTPSWLLEYRHPDREQLKSMREPKSSAPFEMVAKPTA